GSNPKAMAAGWAAARGLVAGREEKTARGGVLNRLGARRQELLALDTIRPEHAWCLSRVTEDHLSKPEDSIDFTRFRIRDLETWTVLFEMAKPCVSDQEEEEEEEEGGEGDVTAGRCVRRQFTPAFPLGDKPVSNFPETEGHYFRGRLRENSDLGFGFGIPRSRNTCERIHEFPQPSEDVIRLMIENLMMPNKAGHACNGGQ
ncbi:hypothetical protein H1C71_007552, partial [Ictidomys tridecemlineatus]|uniref:GMP phosphodiesterase delta subunit domain-containing protein n=1 Tax=Ictidomys tridecemlineatus TaxID=43179 RepID=A0A287D6M9_ICTTR